MKLLEIRHLSVEFGAPGRRTRAVDALTLDLSHGQILCLAGESGSGKSVTALSIPGLLAGAHYPDTKARITLFDEHGQAQQLLHAPQQTLGHIRGSQIGMIFQEPMTSLNPVLTIGEQLDEVLQLHCPELTAHARHQRMRAALAEVHLPDADNRLAEYAHRLSGGQRQRVMIAMALICRPRLLIADEPTTALDVTVQAEILALLQKLRAERAMSILFISHDLGVVSQIADSVAIMRGGRIVEAGAASDVLYQPAHAYTRSLIDALPERLQRPPRREHSAHEPLLLEAQKISVRFGQARGLLKRVHSWHHAVEQVSLALHAGEVLALVGESGSGKSTLARALLRLQDTHSGRIALAGEDITQYSQRALRPLRQQLQMVFQDPGASLNPRLNIAQTLTEPMRVHGIGANQTERLARAANLLARVELPPDSLLRWPHEFSGGQRQRIAIARALAIKPRLLICDEITSALDVSVQAGILQLLHTLVAEEKLGILFITHNIGVVHYLADRVAVLHNGRIVECGDTASVLQHAQNPYTRQLLASVAQLPRTPPNS